jgi:hypothetical protein
MEPRVLSFGGHQLAQFGGEESRKLGSVFAIVTYLNAIREETGMKRAWPRVELDGVLSENSRQITK